MQPDGDCSTAGGAQRSAPGSLCCTTVLYKTRSPASRVHWRRDAICPPRLTLREAVWCGDARRRRGGKLAGRLLQPGRFRRHSPSRPKTIYMVKSVVAASSIEAAFEARAASAATAASVEWGFLVGQAAFRTHDKDYVLATIPAAESEGIVSDDMVDQASQVWTARTRCRQLVCPRAS